VDRASHQLLLFAQQGFDEAFVRTFASVAWDDNTACGRAFRNGTRVIIPDVTLDAAYEPYVDDALAAGYRAVQSTPLLDDAGQVVGVLSTHFPKPQTLSKKACRRLDALARHATRHILEARL
jgi:GAF domain-containing protein